jgi:hypothetical protein
MKPLKNNEISISPIDLMGKCFANQAILKEGAVKRYKKRSP